MDEEEIIVLMKMVIFTDDDYIDYDPTTIRLTLSNCGLGRGIIKNKQKESYNIQSVYEKWCLSSQRIFMQVLHMTKNELDIIIQEMRVYEERMMAQTQSRCFSFESRILLTLFWIIQYPKYSQLSSEFGVSEYIISKTIHETVPFLVEHFVKEIPNRRISDSHSSLSSSCIFVIDGTIHPI
jgi:hypothetical protein